MVDHPFGGRTRQDSGLMHTESLVYIQVDHMERFLGHVSGIEPERLYSEDGYHTMNLPEWI